MDIGTFSDKNTGSISSDVDRYIEIRVPRVITLPAYRLEPAVENPHCGKAPSIPPTRGPSFPDFLIVFLVLAVVLCSIYSMAR